MNLNFRKLKVLAVVLMLGTSAPATSSLGVPVLKQDAPTEGGSLRGAADPEDEAPEAAASEAPSDEPASEAEGASEQESEATPDEIDAGGDDDSEASSEDSDER